MKRQPANWLVAPLSLTSPAARYGRSTPALGAALMQLVQAVYSTRYWTSRWWKGEAGAYLLFKRPTIAIVDFPGHPGDTAKLEAAVRALAAMAPATPVITTPLTISGAPVMA